MLIKIQLPTLDVTEPMRNLVKYIPAAKQQMGSEESSTGEEEEAASKDEAK